MLHSDLSEVVLGRGELRKVSVIREKRRVTVAMLERQYQNGDILRLQGCDTGEELSVGGRATVIEQCVGSIPAGWGLDETGHTGEAGEKQCFHLIALLGCQPWRAVKRIKRFLDHVGVDRRDGFAVLNLVEQAFSAGIRAKGAEYPEIRIQEDHDW